MLQKVAAAGDDSTGDATLNIQEYFAYTRATLCEKSNIQQLNVMDAKADSKDTLISLLYDLHDRYIKTAQQKYLVIEGDAKLYELLQSLKTDYRDELEWVVPFPGDWHTL